MQDLHPITKFYFLLVDGLQYDWLAKITIIFIVLFAMLLVPSVISLTFPYLGNKFKKSFHVYVYSFTTGFFIILATFGFLREALENSTLYSAYTLKATSKQVIYGWNILLVGFGIITGISFSLIVKFVISYKLNKKLLKSKKLSVFVHDHSHDSHQSHSHHDFIFNKEDQIELAEKTLLKKAESKLKVIALLLLLTHRIPEGLLLGYNLNLFIPNQNNEVLANSDSLSLAYFISLVLHLIPEEVVFYIRLKEAGYSSPKALLISFIGLFLFLPFMLIGMFVGQYINNAAKAYIYASVGGIFLFTSLVEFFPEFYHESFNKKKWIWTIVSLFIGVIFATIILSFHSHSH
ncbi:ZIP family metal transporter [Mycoplasma leonicaptivi]|uniref:ZIP family metal transporter n=1 Tax=Mycoplasma leonicaptivi TaxID=36742 RepID=UPI0006860637|nr:ZIP family metal transporter [Mycoplasma leonicaptivi]